jgi:hypothetical protein
VAVADGETQSWCQRRQRRRVAAEYASQVRPEIWRRYLALILDALRPGHTVATVLPEPALSPDQMVQAMRSGTLGRS